MRACARMYMYNCVRACVRVNVHTWRYIHAPPHSHTPVWVWIETRTLNTQTQAAESAGLEFDEDEEDEQELEAGEIDGPRSSLTCFCCGIVACVA